MAAAAESEADARGLQLALFPTDNRPGRERAYVEALAGGHVDGLIFATNHAEHGDLAEAIGAAGRIVLVDEDVCGASAPRVFCDNYAGGRLAGGHLAGLGHRRVAYFGAGLAMLTGRRRYEGLRDGLADVAGAVEPPGLYPCAYSRAGGSAAARAFLADGRPATAILAAADEVAIGALEVLRAAGLRVPRDLSLVGFDDVAPLHLFDPPLTAIRQPIEAIGRRAVRLLTDPEFDSGAAPEEILAVDLMVRASCAPCPA
jgi:LacI family transcriptional regulator